MNPWAGWKMSSCYPDKCQCEAIRDELIRQPSSFFSSIAYIIAGLLIYKHVSKKTFELKLWAAACVLMGISSHLGHMSFVKVFLALDFASIILILSFFAVLNLLRMLKVSSTHILVILALYYAALYFAMYSMNKWGNIGMCLLIFAFSIGDLIRDMGWSFLNARTLQWSLFILCISFGIFVMDEMHIGCEPLSWFQWHSLWHIGTATSMYLYGRWRFAEIRAL